MDNNHVSCVFRTGSITDWSGMPASLMVWKGFACTNHCCGLLIFIWLISKVSFHLLVYKFWLTPMESHPAVVIVLCTKLHAECDRQATVVGRLLTTLGDDRRAVAKLFLVQRLGKWSRENYAYFLDIRISYLFDKYSPSSGGFRL